MGQPRHSIEKRNLRINEFLVAYNIGRGRFYAEVASGRLKVFKCGRTTLISREAAEAWLSAVKSL